MTRKQKIDYLDRLKKQYPIILVLRDKFELKVIDVYATKETTPQAHGQR